MGSALLWKPSKHELSAVIVTFNHEETLLSGKVHVVEAGDLAADSRGRSALESRDDGLI